MEEKQQIGQLFDRIAGTYDGLNHGLSMNTDRRWRRKTVKCMPEAEHVLDVAIGTADFDGVTCAFGCRNFQNLDEGLQEMYRVLKPGGQVTILEFSYPSNRLVRAMYDLYFSHILPTIGRIVSRDKTAYTYLNKSVKHFCWGDEFVKHLLDAGFAETSYKNLSFGIAMIYTAKKS